MFIVSGKWYYFGASRLASHQFWSASHLMAGMELEVDTLCLVHWKFQGGSGSWKWIGGGISWIFFGMGRGWKLPGKGGHMTLGSKEINMIFVIGFHR